MPETSAQHEIGPIRQKRIDETMAVFNAISKQLSASTRTSMMNVDPDLLRSSLMQTAGTLTASVMKDR